MDEARAVVLGMLEGVDPKAQVIETVRLPVDPTKTKRFETWADGLTAETRKLPGLQTHEWHRALGGDASEYFLYEVWDDREALRGLWNSEFLARYQGQLATEQLLVGPPDLKLFLRKT